MTDDTFDIRFITDDERPAWLRALNTGFLQAPAVSEERAEARRIADAGQRVYGVFEGDRVVGAFRSYDQELTVPGGQLVPANAISNVTVLPTHRRRGILTRVMGEDLRAAKERGDVAATLIAAEYAIYGRYGFGPATSVAEWTIDVPRTGLDPRWAAPECGGRIEMVDPEEVRKTGPELHERVRRGQVGAVSRVPQWWDAGTGVLRVYEGDRPVPTFVAYRSPEGSLEGMAAYEVDDAWTGGGQAANTLTVKWLIGTSPRAERALWHFLCSIDWVTTVKSGQRGPDDLLPRLFPDPRAVGITQLADWLWVRILDVERALAARTYAGSGELVLEVDDAAGLAGGRFLLAASPEGASCARSTRGADLALDVTDLASLWLGDESVARLAALGRVREVRAGAVREADALLRTSGRPWCPDMF
ncbi:GNAT family N-acetyltransferase [Streptomyces roseirectus]|uniref:GNAT family N-acetyltransferase n=1 Tax=Streptomyces roseirectus TaxID=2768066 RepID=A0A7H0IEX2_9ACTN|nr:GNAT family N-acetyltransferase [Streptomyces roseirectus]QNP71338.1 GNAT family N-acetyltransferase [Streptomyces roseirectus]